MTGRTLEVLATPWGLPALDRETRFCVVIDVLRACTCIVHAFDAGARGIIPVESVEGATRLAQTLDRETLLLCGERDNVRIEGFDLGNSPAEYVPDVVRDKTLVLSTTNGARALAALGDARGCIAAAFVNLSACARRAAIEDHITIVCAASGVSFSLEDFVCAGRIVEEIGKLAPGSHVLDDGARTALEAARAHAADLPGFLRETDHGRRLVEQGFEADLDLAARADRFSLVPILKTGRLVADPQLVP